jgi:hypothetical protein
LTLIILTFETGFQVTCHACPAKGSRQARAGSILFESKSNARIKKQFFHPLRCFYPLGHFLKAFGLWLVSASGISLENWR